MSESDDITDERRQTPDLYATFIRVEKKLERIESAISKLILIEERQLTQAARLAVVETRIEAAEQKILKTDAKVEKWVNRGWGVWIVVTLLGATVLALIKNLKWAIA